MSKLALNTGHGKTYVIHLLYITHHYSCSLAKIGIPWYSQWNNCPNATSECHPMSPNGNQLPGAPNGGMDQTGSPSVDLPNGPSGLKVDVGETNPKVAAKTISTWVLLWFNVFGHALNVNFWTPNLKVRLCFALCVGCWVSLLHFRTQPETEPGHKSPNISSTGRYAKSCTDGLRLEQRAK